MLCFVQDETYVFQLVSQQRSIKSLTTTLGSGIAYIQVSSENNGLHACLPL
jgi:hypothetical protein